MIMEMERVIQKRDAIQLKYEPKVKGPKAGSQVAMKRQVAALKSNLKLATEEASKTDVTIKERDDEMRVLQQNVEQAALETSELERSVESTQAEMHVMNLMLEQSKSKVTNLQLASHRIETLLQGDTIPPSKAAAIQAQAQDVAGTYKRVNIMLENIAESFPAIEPVASAARQWHESAKDLVLVQ